VVVADASSVVDALIGSGARGEWAPSSNTRLSWVRTSSPWRLRPASGGLPIHAPFRNVGHMKHFGTFTSLAEAFALPLMTTDERLARTRGHRAAIIAQTA
jgi:hypothetical protein